MALFPSFHCITPVLLYYAKTGGTLDNALVVDFDLANSFEQEWQLIQNRSPAKGKRLLKVDWLKILPVKESLNHYRRDAGVYAGPGFLGCMRLLEQLQQAANDGRISLPENWEGRRVIFTAALFQMGVRTAFPCIHQNGRATLGFVDTAEPIKPDMYWCRVEEPRDDDPRC